MIFGVETWYIMAVQVVLTVWAMVWTGIQADRIIQAIQLPPVCRLDRENLDDDYTQCTAAEKKGGSSEDVDNVPSASSALLAQAAAKSKEE